MRTPILKQEPEQDSIVGAAIKGAAEHGATSGGAAVSATEGTSIVLSTGLKMATGGTSSASGNPESSDLGVPSPTAKAEDSTKDNERDKGKDKDKDKDKDDKDKDKEKATSHTRCRSYGVGANPSIKVKLVIQNAQRLNALAKESGKKPTHAKEAGLHIANANLKKALDRVKPDDPEKLKTGLQTGIAGLIKENQKAKSALPTAPMAPMKEAVKPRLLPEDHKVPEAAEAPAIVAVCISGKEGSMEGYVVGKQIGHGAYATVRLAYHKDLAKNVALKVYEKKKLVEPQRQKSVYREIRLLEKMSHPNVVKLYEAFDTRRHVILVMEYVRGKSLHSYLKAQPNRQFEEWEAKTLFRQVVGGIEYCHSKSIAHRDIKLENLLLDEHNNVKIIDFGFSTCIPNTKKIKIFCGTPSYMSPEIVLRQEYAGPPADVWALGVLLYAMLCGTFPFKGRNDKELYKRISRGQAPLPEHLSPGAKLLLQRMLQVDPDRRPTSHELLSDKWFSGVGEEPLFHKVGKDTPKAGDSRPGINLEAYLAYYSDQPYLARSEVPELPPHPAKPSTSNGGTVNNNINIINNITHINCGYNGSLTYSNQSFSSKGGSNSSLLAKNSNSNTNFGLEGSKATDSLDAELLSSIVKLGYSVEEVKQQLQNEQSHIYKLYNKLLDEKRQLNLAVAPQVVPSIVSSFDTFKSKSRLGILPVLSAS
jgi:serine/threonine protein kinase